MLTILSRADETPAMGSAPVRHAVLWPDEDSGPWLVVVWWRAQHGKAVPVGLEIRPWFTEAEHQVWEAAGLTGLPLADADVAFPAIDSKFIKSLPIGRIQAKTKQNALDLFQGDSAEDLQPTPMAGVLEAFRGGGSTRGLGDAHYAEVAKVYGQAVNSRRNPTTAVAEHFVVSKSAAAKQVARARDRGFLPKTTRGRVGRLSEEL